MRSSVLIASACVVFSALAALSACSSPSVPDDGLAAGEQDQNKTTAAKKDGGTGSTTNTSGGTATTNPTPTGGGDASTGGAIVGTGACASNGNQDTCYDCCDKANPKAIDFLDQKWGDCACVTPGTCKTQCAASFCAATYVDPKMGDACDTCLNGVEQSC